MPLEVEGKLFDRLLVGYVVHLLEDERAHESVGVLGWATQSGVEDGGDRLDRQGGAGSPCGKVRPRIDRGASFAWGPNTPTGRKDRLSVGPGRGIWILP